MKLHRAYVVFLERGERNISVDTIVVISEALGVAPWVVLLPKVRNWM
ncbi:MAG: helix-turn-helix transcriptional regulator [Bacteroidetes bacterium]|nr:helix-turn-helix transcriptional regulator [Bacteroidota bacterium]